MSIVVSYINYIYNYIIKDKNHIYISCSVHISLSIFLMMVCIVNVFIPLNSPFDKVYNVLKNAIGVLIQVKGTMIMVSHPLRC